MRLRILLLMASDAACIVLSMAFSIWLYWAIGFGHYKFGWEFYLRLWPMALAFVAVNATVRLYHGNAISPSAPVTPEEELRRLVGSSMLTHLGLIAYLALAFQTTEHYSRAVIVMSGGVSAFLAQPLRDLVRRCAFRFASARIPVVLSGEGELLLRLGRILESDAYLGFRAVKTVGPDMGDIVAAARETGAKILVSCLDQRVLRCQMTSLVRYFAHIEYMPSASSFPVSGGHIVSFDGVGGIEMVNRGHFRILRVEKLVLDKALALAAFALLSPFFVLVPILIKLTSRGPVFYRQDRLGKMGRPIRVWKFRSMYADADARLKAILESDPARRLFNVFAGDMALVGPRPIVEKEVHYYGSSYEMFASVKPGITGLWQASGRSDTDYPRRVALDVHYVLNWSPWMDIWILFRTVYAVVFMRGAR